jgi:hypothetical protein
MKTPKTNRKIKNRVGRQLIGHVGVDSGQICIMDPCYLLGEVDHNNFYKKCCSITCSDKQAGSIPYEMGHEGLAVVSSSGFGDGLYGVWATFKDNRVSKVEILF